MLRSNVARSRAEKAGKAAAAPTPAIAQEIVPGKYNDQDWNLMLDHDDGDDFIFDIVEDTCNAAIDIIFQNYLQRQLVPYTVVQAKDAILQIIEWQFLARDEGESGQETDAGWIQDEEPEPALTDCWAQGAVPHKMITPRAVSTVHMIQEEDEEAEAQPAETIMEIPSSPGAAAQSTEDENRCRTEGDAGQEEENTAIEEDSIPAEENLHEEEGTMGDQEDNRREQEQEEETPEMQEAHQPVVQSDTKKKKPYKRHTGRLGSAGVSKMTESLEQAEIRMLEEEPSPSPLRSPDPTMMQMPTSCHSILKLQNGRPPGNRDIVYDESGNVVSVTKLDPDRLPSHKVKTGFHVVDPAVEAAQAQLEAMRTGRYLKKFSASQRQGPQPPDSPRSTLSRTTVGRHTMRTDASKPTNYGRTKEGVTPLPPPLIESMEVSAGVIVREGDRVKAGPRQHSHKAEPIASATLRPLTLRANVPTLNVAELLEHRTPVVKPLVDSAPIPPIAANRQISSQ